MDPILLCTDLILHIFIHRTRMGDSKFDLAFNHFVYQSSFPQSGLCPVIWTVETARVKELEAF
jgi:hypothetical protein